MEKEAVVNFIHDGISKNFTGTGVYAKRPDSAQIYNALMSVNLETPYDKIYALLQVITKNVGIKNENLDKFIEIIGDYAKKEETLASNVNKEVAPTPVEEVKKEVKEENNITYHNVPKVAKEDDLDDELKSETAKGNIMVFIISLLIVIIIILAIIIILFC